MNFNLKIAGEVPTLRSNLIINQLFSETSHEVVDEALYTYKPASLVFVLFSQNQPIIIMNASSIILHCSVMQIQMETTHCFTIIFQWYSFCVFCYSNNQFQFPKNEN